MGTDLDLPRAACVSLETALACEWVEADGVGGYAASTPHLCPTRRQHGLLVAPAGPDGRRHLFLSRFEETLEVDGHRFPLSLGRYPDLFSPHGHLAMERFSPRPFPVATYRIGGATLTREILRPRGTPTVLVRWTLSGAPRGATLRLRPLLPFRDANALTHENGALSPRVERVGRLLRLRPYPELPAISFAIGGGGWRFDLDPTWYRRIELPADLARGYEGHEDAFSPGSILAELAPDRALVVAASIAEPPADPAAAFDVEAAARRDADALASAVGGLRGLLAAGADRCLLRRPDGTLGAIAGFPWYPERARDDAIALPGLLLELGRPDDLLDAALGLLARAGDDPMAPDAGLFAALAARRAELAGASPARVRGPLLDALAALAASFVAGRIPGCTVDDAGLLRVDASGPPRTWMDAALDGRATTPRGSHPVEIEALWIFLHAYLGELHASAGHTDAARTHRERARQTGAAFHARFWLPGPRYLADTWGDMGPDATLRPNMVLAAALEWSPLSRAERRDVVSCAEAALLTPVGLRTLAPADPAYAPRAEGSIADRERASCQGPVRPWLLGAFVEASLRAFGHARSVRARLRALLDGLAPTVRTGGLGHLPETFDGDPPHRPGGAFAFAPSDGEVLRAYALLDAPRLAKPGRP